MDHDHPDTSHNHSNKKPPDVRKLLLQFSLSEESLDEDEESCDNEEQEEVDEEASSVHRRSSVALPSPSVLEKLFLEILSSGSIKDLDNFIVKNNFGEHINCVNIHGVSALQTAIMNSDEMMVKYLLSLPTIQIRDGALLAIRGDQITILKLILQWQESQIPGSEFEGYPNSNDFPACITPLILAAQLGRLEIVVLLLERGHNIFHPHPPTCQCERVCQRQNERCPTPPSHIINIYRAISNPVYIFQTSDNPFLSAFQLSQELELCSKFYHVFRSSYEELMQRTKMFAVELIDCCRDVEEVETVLKRKKGTSLRRSRFKHPLLLVAMDHGQKEFVAHPNIQQVLDCVWIGRWMEWEKHSSLQKFLIVLSRVFLLPWVMFVTLCLRKSRYGRFYSIPVNVMINSMASYLIFLLLLGYQSNQNKASVRRGLPHSGAEIFIILYVFSFLCNAGYRCYLLGSQRFFRIRWNCYEVTQSSLFILTFMFWVAAYTSVRLYNQEDLERKYWHFLDPTLVAESLFAIDTVISYCYLLFLCQLSYELGPMQVSVGKMTEDIIKFSVLFGIIMLAFTVGLCRLYQYYEGMVQVDPETDQIKRQEDSFINPMNTFRTLFWAIFCMSSMDAPAVIIENMNDTACNVNYINKHYFTEFTGYFLFAAFEVLMVIVMLNMLSLILLRSHSSDVDWMFGRSQVYLRYMCDVATPPPLNVLAVVQRLWRHHERRQREYVGYEKNVKWLDDGDIGDDCPADTGRFNRLMSLLVQRYFRRKTQARQSAHEDFGKTSFHFHES